MGERDRDTIVTALFEAAYDALRTATPETRQESDARILLYTGIMATFTAAPAVPEIIL